MSEKEYFRLKLEDENKVNDPKDKCHWALIDLTHILGNPNRKIDEKPQSIYSCPKSIDVPEYCCTGDKESFKFLYKEKNKEEEVRDITWENAHNTFNLITKGHLICSHCNLAEKRKLEYCTICGVIMCINDIIDCPDKHFKENHETVKIEEIFTNCFEHELPFKSYCEKCNKNMCQICAEEEEKNEHESIPLSNVKLKCKSADVGELKKQINEHKEEYRKEVNNIIEKVSNYLNTLKEKSDQFMKKFAIYDTMIATYENHDKNYHIIKNTVNLLKNKENIKKQFKKFLEDVKKDSPFKEKIKPNNVKTIDVINEKKISNDNSINNNINNNVNNNVNNNEEKTKKMINTKNKLKEMAEKLNTNNQNNPNTNDGVGASVFDIEATDENSSTNYIEISMVLDGKGGEMNFYNEKAKNCVKNVFFRGKPLNRSSMVTKLGRTGDMKFKVVLNDNITSFKGLFEGCDKLKDVILTNVAQNNCTDFSSMFKGCSMLKTVIDIPKLLSNKASNLSSLFEGCGIEEIDLSEVEMDNVRDVSCMFKNCSLLKKIILFKKNIKEDIIYDDIFENINDEGEMLFSSEANVDRFLDVLPSNWGSEEV